MRTMLAKLDADDPKVIRECLRNLVALATLPAVWSGADPRRIAESLAAALYSTLEAAFIYVEIAGRAGEPGTMVAQTGRYNTDPALAAHVGSAVKEWARARDPHDVLLLKEPSAGSEWRVAVRPLGFDAEFGVLAAGFSDQHSPTPAQHLMLSIVANQALPAIQNALLNRSLRETQESVRRANEELAASVAELQRTNAELRDSRRAALNVMEDAVQSRARAEMLNQELARHKEDLERRVQERTAELEASHRQLRLSERMAAMGTLSAGLGHDMGNLLVPIRVRLESVAAMNLPQEAQQELNGLRGSTDYLQKLASGLRLLAVDPGRTPSFEPTELHDWWEEAIGVLRNAMPRGVALESQMPNDPCWVGMPNTALTQAVFNLVQNAGDAMKDRSRGVVKVAVEQREGAVFLTVSDNGPGMTDEVKQRCMEPFYTTKTRALSTGLGLSLVYGLVQDAGGSIRLESDFGVGTTFTLKLPAAKPPMSAETLPSPRSALVDVTDERMRAILAAELQELRFDVHFDKERVRSADLVVADHGDWNGDMKGRLLALTTKELAPRAAIALGEKPRVQAVRDAVRQMSRELVSP